MAEDRAWRLPAAICDVPRLKERAGVDAIEEDVANDFCASAYFFSANCFTPRAVAACEFVSRQSRAKSSPTMRSAAITPHLDFPASPGTTPRPQTPTATHIARSEPVHSSVSTCPRGQRPNREHLRQ